MKIVHLCLSGPFNDNWGYQDNLIPKYNIKDGHEVTVITSTQINKKNGIGFDYVEPSTYFSNAGFKVIRIPFSNFIPSKFVVKIRLYRSIYPLLMKEKPDFIFAHGFNFLNLLEVKRYINQHTNVRLVVDTHASYDNSAKNIISEYVLHRFIWRGISKSIIQYVDKVFSVAPACKDFACDVYQIPNEIIEPLYLGADTDKIRFSEKEEIRKEIREKLDINKDDFVLITGGKLSKGKNTKMLLSAVEQIKEDRLKLIIFGRFSEEIESELNNLINKDNRVRYIGWIEGDDVYDYYLASDLAIFPGTKSALWEQAICSGLPLICKRWSGMEYVDIGGNVKFIVNDSVSELSNSIEQVLSNKKLYEHMEQIARENGKKFFSYESISRRALK